MAGRNSQGSRLYHSYGDTASSYVLVESVTNIAGPNATAAEIDVSDLESTQGEVLPGLGSSATITVDLNWRGASKQVQLYNMFSNSADPEYFKIAMPTDSTRTVFDVFEFQASVNQYNIGAQVNNKQTAQIVLKTSGAVVLSQNVALANLDD